MLVGLMHPFKDPTPLAKDISIKAKSKGIDILYMHPSNINEGDHTTSGMILNGDTWEEVQTSIPETIDVSAFCLKFKHTIKYLRERAYLTEDGRNKIWGRISNLSSMLLLHPDVRLSRSLKASY